MAPSNAKALVREDVVVGGNTQYHPARLLRIRRLGVRVPPSALLTVQARGYFRPPDRGLPKRHVKNVSKTVTGTPFCRRPPGTLFDTARVKGDGAALAKLSGRTPGSGAAIPPVGPSWSAWSRPTTCRVGTRMPVRSSQVGRGRWGLTSGRDPRSRAIPSAARWFSTLDVSRGYFRF